MEDKKSERGRDDRMRKLTEGDGGSWVNLSSKSSQSRPIPISALPRQESFSPWPCLLLCLWRKDGARLSMIGDGHYLNTIFEPGPSPLATTVRLETTLMRRKMMGHPATPSPFINSDKMVSTLSWNAQQPPSTSINIDFFTMCHSVHLSAEPSFRSCLLAPHTFAISETYIAPGAFPSLYLMLSSPMWAFLISCPCLLSVWLRGVFVNGSCLSLPTCCSSEACPQSASGEIDRTLRCFALCCHAPAQQVGKSELAGSVGRTTEGGAVWRHLTSTDGACTTLHAN